ncbi:serine O-acetyltransferase [Methanobrevibacter sp. 87.7]|uniref:serine O-acetyltransferase n=1 Tax=Methanobrevibacter sp. 87.7 TaxID=387957 RepID=UPI000B511D32|nr:serine O-acetyltransferase [Methanobrevibacter sp. 87.7]OWT32721.1 serine O-acetyltransferase [Methanobrevibacter sp. 87.7]
MFNRIREDIMTAKMRDPASRSTIEILFCYPGVYAVWFHLISHWLWKKGAKFLARFNSTIARFLTGVEIHPGATIGRRVFIDHGMGIVIGETAIVSNDVLIYQGAVLGGTSLEKKKRHPTIGDAVVVGAGAKVMGDITIGDSSKIGAGSVVLKDVPPHSTCVGIPGRVVKTKDKSCPLNLEHNKLPDPVKNCLQELVKRQDELENELETLKKLYNISNSGININNYRRYNEDVVFEEGGGI